MIRLLIPFLFVVIASWAMLYGIKPAQRRTAWVNVRHALVAISIGLGVIAAVTAVFSILGGLNG